MFLYTTQFIDQLFSGTLAGKALLPCHSAMSICPASLVLHLSGSQVATLKVKIHICALMGFPYQFSLSDKKVL